MMGLEFKMTLKEKLNSIGELVVPYILDTIALGMMVTISVFTIMKDYRAYNQHQQILDNVRRATYETMDEETKDKIRRQFPDYFKKPNTFKDYVRDWISFSNDS